MNEKEMREQAQALVKEAIEIYSNSESTAEDVEKAKRMQAEAGALQEKAGNLAELRKAAVELADQEQEEKTERPPVSGFKGVGDYLLHVYNACNPDRKATVHPSLMYFGGDAGEGKVPATKASQGGRAAAEWESKQLVESIGASGGFLVPPEYLPNLVMGMWEQNIIMQRAVVIPMRRRQVNVPVLDQTGTTAGQPHQYGGVIAEWTPETGTKPRHEPEFRQIELVAHLLAIYAEASKELLMDSAIGLSVLLGRLFTGAIEWEADYAFLRGTGAGQPLGVLNAGATHIEPRFAAGTVSPSDFARMLMHFQGSNPIWHMSRSAMAALIQLNGPAANPSYIFMPGSFVNQVPDTLFGAPIQWTEKLPVLGVQGDVLLADWGWYYIGDREAVTIDVSTHYRFRYNLTAWRAEARLDGQPMLSQPFTLADGVTQVSPFVILGDVST